MTQCTASVSFENATAAVPFSLNEPPSSFTGHETSPVRYAVPSAIVTVPEPESTSPPAPTSITSLEGEMVAAPEAQILTSPQVFVPETACVPDRVAARVSKS